MATIEEKITKRADSIYVPKESEGFINSREEMQRIGYIRGAIDQDSISRADEREKCICKAWNWVLSHTDAHLGDLGDLIKSMREQ